MLVAYLFSISSKHYYASAGMILQVTISCSMGSSCAHAVKASTVGSTSAVALSHDHTYVASGHVSGYIQIFELKNPETPARTVAPPSAQAITSGRQEGHLAGSRIVNVSFVAGRHTAIISADENGLAFYHSLGKVLFVEASDTIRILGNYPQELNHEGTSSISVLNAPGARSFRRRKPRNTLLTMATLPLGTVAHPTDKYQIVALLTTNKLVIVGLKPSPKTWLKRPRPNDTELTSLGRRRGTLAWFPSVNTPHEPKDADSDKTHPALAYSWGRSVRLLRVSETIVKQTVLNPRTGKTREVDAGTLVFEDAGSWTVDDAVVALQWLNVNVRIPAIEGNEFSLTISIATACLYSGHAQRIRRSDLQGYRTRTLQRFGTGITISELHSRWVVVIL